jgi:hypothetical protein
MADAADTTEIERRMQPGAWDGAGFLRPGTSLPAVQAQDAETTRRLGLDAQTIGARLGEQLDAAADSDMGRPVTVGDLRVELLRARGFLTCPWAPEEFEPCPVGLGGRATANRFTITDASGRRLSGYELSAHLIRDHAFFGGPGTRYRLEPAEVAEILGLARAT